MSEDKKYRSLARNMAIYTVGTFGSKVLTFLILPLYTYYLSTEDYGNIDLFSTAVSLMLPFTSLVIYEAVIRFATKNEISKEAAVCVCVIVFLVGAGIALAGVPTYKYLFGNKSDFVLCYVICLIASTYNLIFGQYLRAAGQNVAFAVNGIIVTFVTVFSNVFFLVALKMGVKGYLYSLILAQLLASVQATIGGKIFQKFSFKYFHIHTAYKMLKYCIPLIPNNIMWWIMNAGDKYFINYYLGDSANGIYALAVKIPTIMNLIFSIFMQAWQLSAIEENDTEKQADFYSDIFRYAAGILILTASLGIILVKPVFVLTMSTDFRIAWMYVPPLCIAMVVGCLSTFTGVAYMAKLCSPKLFYTTFLGAVINLLVNFLLIQKMGLYGVAIGTGAGYLIVFAIRCKDAKKLTGMSFDRNRTIMGIAVLVLQSILFLYIDSYLIYPAEIICLFFLLAVYKKDFCKMLSIIVKRRH